MLNQPQHHNNKLFIRLAQATDIISYTDLLQRTYESAYVDESIGLTPDCFSKEVFASQHTQDYLKDNLKINENQKTWLAFIEDKLVGSVTLTHKNNEEVELRGFYIDPEFQGRGIGKQLWAKALAFAQHKIIILDIYSHNKKAIEIYKKWGFEIDNSRGKFTRHWPEWPQGLEAECIYMKFEDSK